MSTNKKGSVDAGVEADAGEAVAPAEPNGVHGGQRNLCSPAGVLEVNDLKGASNNASTTGGLDSEDVPPAAARRPDRDGRGLFAAENRISRTHGVSAFRARGAVALPPGLRAEMESFAAAVESDQGGEVAAIRGAYIRRVVEAETILRLLAEDIRARGLFTARGHARSAARLYLKAVAGFDRVASRLGLDRVARRGPTLADLLVADEPTPRHGAIDEADGSGVEDGADRGGEAEA